MTIIYFLVLLAALAAILALLQWAMYCQAKRPEGEKAPNTSLVDHDDTHALRMYYFYSDTCGPCRSIKPMVDRLQQEHSNLIKVNIAEHHQLAKDFGVTGVPSFIVVEDDVIKAVKLGRASQKWIVNWLSGENGSETGRGIC